MTTKDRRFVYEGAAMGAAGFFGTMVIPTLLSTRDSVAVLCGAMLFLGWLCWLAYFFYRVITR